jgi:hypothetical protein
MQLAALIACALPVAKTVRVRRARGQGPRQNASSPRVKLKLAGGPLLTCPRSQGDRLSPISLYKVARGRGGGTSTWVKPPIEMTMDGNAHYPNRGLPL